MNASNIFFIVGIVYLINLLSIIAIVYFERKKTISAVVWILVLTILPLIGFILYFIFGKNFHLFQRKKFKNKREFDALYKSWITDEKHIFKSKNNTISAEKLEKYHDFIEMNINAGGSIYSQDNDITLFTSAKENYASLFKDIENASNTVQVFYFSINNDDIGRKFINLLAKKASDGVRIRLMYDHAGSWISPGSMFAPLINAGGKVYSFFPLKFGTYTRYNYRNHRKIVIIDGTIAYMGGMNIGDEYLGLDKRLTPWRDTHIRLTGSAVHSVQLRFLMDWYYSAENEEKIDDAMLKRLFPPPVKKGNIGVQLVSSGPDSVVEQIKRGFIKMILSSKEKLYIQTPYFIPDKPLLDALQIAAMSGVDVRIMLPSISDKSYVHKAAHSYIKELLDYGVKVYFYPGFLHAKMIVMDGDITSFGSSNMDIRSFMLDFEINIFIYNSEFSKKCLDVFEKDMRISKTITKEWCDSKTFWVKFQEGLFRILGPIF